MSQDHKGVKMLNADEIAINLASGFAIPAHDYIGITNNVENSPTKVEYKDGGAGGTLVGTTDITYEADGVTPLTVTFTP